MSAFAFSLCFLNGEATKINFKKMLRKLKAVFSSSSSYKAELKKEDFEVREKLSFSKKI